MIGPDIDNRWLVADKNEHLIGLAEIILADYDKLEAVFTFDFRHECGMHTGRIGQLYSRADELIPLIFENTARIVDEAAAAVERD